MVASRCTGVTDKLNVVMAAEVAGYSRLVAEDADEALHQLMGCHALFEACAQQHRGRLLDAAGGRILAEFANGVDALRCALETQDGLHARNESFEPNRQMHFRIGIGTGEVLEADSEAAGEGVTEATRLAQFALAGGICLSRAVRDEVTGQVPADFKAIGEPTVEEHDAVHAFVVERKVPERTVKTVAPRPHRNNLDSGHNGGRARLLGVLGIGCLLLLLAWALLTLDFAQTAKAPETPSPALESRQTPAVGEGVASKPKASSPEPSAPPVEAAARSGENPSEAARDGAAEGPAAIRPEPATAVTGTADLSRSQQSDDGSRDNGLGCLRYIPEASLSVWVPCGSVDQPGDGRLVSPTRKDIRQAPAHAPSPKLAGPAFPHAAEPSVSPPDGLKEVRERKRRPQNCAEIIERAQLGELSNQDRTYLQTQCR